MCRFVAYLGPPVTLESVVLRPPHALVHQSYAPRHQRHGRVNADGFGVGWYDRSVRAEPARYRSDRPMWSDRSVASLAGLVRSGVVLGAVRDATPPAAVEESGSPPFTSGPWLFAHNGVVTGFAHGVGPRLRRLVARTRRAGIEGASDSEVVFALVLGLLDSGATAVEAVAGAVAAVEAVAPARLNLVLTDGTIVVASAGGDSLFLLDDPWRGREPGRGTVVASEPYDDDPRWLPVPDRTIVAVDQTGVTLSLLGPGRSSPVVASGMAPPAPPSGDLVNTYEPGVRVDVHLQPVDLSEALRHDARRGLGDEPKWLPPKWFYDERGSALFDDITRLEEYYPTRRETEILACRAGEIAALCRADTLIELGSGTSHKTRLLLDALVAESCLARVVPFDVSEATLRDAAAALAGSYPQVEVHAVVGDFERHLPLLPVGGRRLVAFLGGTIGNLEPPARAVFLAEVAASLAPGDALLLGTDLVKDPTRLVAAYDDAEGVTAAFNANVLAVLNRELGADFDLERFVHVAHWDPDHERIEMRLRSTADQKVTLAEIDLCIAFAEGEELRTEISAKFRRERVEAELADAGLRLAHWWTDDAGDFALSLSFPTGLRR